MTIMTCYQIIRDLSFSLYFLLFFILCSSFFTTFAGAADNSEDVLILHSYHPGLSWTADINRALQAQLLKNRPELSMQVEYLDLKRNQAAWYRDSYIEGVLVKKLKGRHFKLVFTSDNDAFNFALRHRDDLFRATPIVFCGVNGFTPDMLTGISSITGIAEIPAFAKTISLAIELHPDTRELVFIGETETDTGRMNLLSLKKVTEDLEKKVDVVFWNDQTLPELKNRLQTLVSGQVIFLTGTISDGEKILDFAETAWKIRGNSPVPVYGFWDFFLGNGIVGGRLINAETQGKEAAKLGLQILAGVDVGTIPVKISDANRFMFDNNELTRFRISHDKLPDNSLIINLPSSTYQLYKWQLWTGLAFIVLLSLCISLLLNIIVSRRKNEKELSERARLASLAAEIGRALTTETSLEQALQHCCESLLKQTETAFARIWVTDETEPDLLELRASAGLFTRIKESTHRFKKFGQSKVGLIASERKPILTNQVTGDPQFRDQEWIKKDRIAGFAGYPLVINNRTVGVVALFSQQPLTEYVQYSIASVADMIAVGIERYHTGLALQKSIHDAEDGRDNTNAILRSVAEGLIVTDLDQKIVLVNEAAEKLLGINFKQVCGMMLDEATKGRAFSGQLQNLIKNSDTEIEFSIPTTHGMEHRIVQARKSYVHHQKIGRNGIITILHDVTRLRELDQMKSEFIAIAAHELRTPLATIQGYAELMHNPELSAGITPEQQHEYLGYILDRSTALEQITNDLLDVGRAETGRKLILERTPCEMVAMVHEIVNHHRRESPIHSFVVDCPDICLNLNVDRNMIHRVFDNLLSNAVKYSPKGGTIRIKGEMDNQILVVTVKDEGVGMTPEQINQAFNKFYRADTSNTAVRGLGLGLTICKTIIEAHGGIIWIDSHPGEGAAFHFSLPIYLPEA